MDIIPGLPVSCQISGIPGKIVTMHIYTPKNSFSNKLGLPTESFIRPIGVYSLLEIPIGMPDGKIEYVPPEHFFLNPRFNTKEQQIAILKYLRDQEYGRPLIWGQSRIFDRCNLPVNYTKPESLGEEKLQELARLFCSFYRPSIYHYQGRPAPRIGHAYRIILNISGTLRDLLIEAEAIPEEAKLDSAGNIARKSDPSAFSIMGMPIRRRKQIPVDEEKGLGLASKEDIKIILDETIRDLYASMKINVTLPETTSQNLHTAKGRLKYLREINALNAEGVKAFLKTSIDTIAQQLGIIHGLGGSVGGGRDLSPIGNLVIALTNGKVYRIILSEKGSHGYSDNGWASNVTKKDIVSIGSFYTSGSKAELGALGGGSTRADNMGPFGLRDYSDISLFNIAPDIETLIDTTHPEEIKNNPQIRAALRYLYTGIKQKNDLDLLFCSKPPIGFISPGSFFYLVSILGGNYTDYAETKSQFMQAYHKWRDWVQGQVFDLNKYLSPEERKSLSEYLEEKKASASNPAFSQVGHSLNEAEANTKIEESFNY